MLLLILRREEGRRRREEEEGVAYRLPDYLRERVWTMQYQ